MWEYLRMGANTAGVGVCFRSRAQWERLFAEQGWQTVSYAEGPEWRLRALLRRPFHVGRTCFSHFWIHARP